MSEISAPPPPPPSGQPPPPPPPLPTAVTLPPAQAQVPIPPTLLNALVGARFDAQLINVTPQGVLTLQGDFGRVQLQLQSPLRLAPGDNLVLQLSTKGNALQFTIATVNGANAGAARIAASGALPGTTGIGPLGAPPAPAFDAGNLLTATLLRPAAVTVNPAQPGTAPAQLGQPTGGAATLAQPPGAAQPNALTTPSVPGSVGTGQQTPTSITGQTNAPSPAFPAGPTATPGQTGAQSANLPAGTQLTVQVTSLQPPPPGGASAVTPPTGPAIFAQGQVLTGVVTGANAGGQPIVETILGPVALNATNPPPEGTRVTLTISSPPIPPAATEPILDNQNLFLRQALFANRQWPALNETLETLEQAAPNTAMQMVQTALPRPDGNLAANILYFLAALRGGDLRSWLGDQPMRVLQRVNPGLVNRLRDDMGRMSRMSEEPNTGDWRTAMVPFHNGEALDQIRFLTRRQDNDDDGDEDNTGTRFVVDVTLTKLGHIQLDGLVNSGRRRLDMVVRSDSHLPKGMQNDIRTLYEKASGITGYQGGVGFQAQPANFVEVSPPPDTGGDGVGLVV